MRLERWVYIVRLRLRSLFRLRRVEDDLSDEIRFHLDARISENLARGMTPDAARDAALRAFGGVEQRKEECRDRRRVGLITDLVRDVGFALRMMRRSPGFSAVAVLSLALGIGANTAIFSVLDELALRKLPVPDPDRLVLVSTEATISHAQFGRLQELSTVFSGMAAIWTVDRSNFTIGSEPDAGQVRVGLASAGYFSTLGLTASVGRTFAPDEDRVAGGHPIAVISDAFWERRFDRAPNIVGRTFGLNGITYDIIGVAPRGFTGEWVGMPTDLWVPFMMASQVLPEIPGGAARFPRRVLARLAPGLSREQARVATELLYRQILTEEAGARVTREWSDQIARMPISVESAAKGYSPQREEFAQPIAILMAAVGVLLLVACANLANLLLARSAGRQRELAVRLAIGAGHGRLARQLLTESVVLSAAGGVAGAVLAMWATRTLAAMMAAAPVSMGGTSSQALVLNLRFDAPVMAFTAAVCVLSGVVFGAAPALAAWRIRVTGSLNAASTRVVGHGPRFGPSKLLVVAQVALSLLLLIGAGLFLRTLDNLRAQNLGMEREHELLVWTAPGQIGRQDAAMADLWHTVQERVSAIPGVVSAAQSNQPVLSGYVYAPGSPTAGMRVDGELLKTSTHPGFRSFITPGFFATLGAPIVSGRDFTERDTETAPRVVILNETMARFYFGDRDPIGRMVRFTGPTGPATEIVGVASDFVKGSPRAGAQAEFATYFPYRDPEALNRGAQTRLRVMLLVVRTAGDPLALAESVRRELRAIDPALPILRINTTEQQLDDVLAQDRLIATLSASFGVLAVVLASLGLFGLVSHRVARRTNEIGVRLALGATRTSVLGMIVGESGRLVAAGLALGLVAAFALARLIATRLYGVTATDPWTIAAATLLLAAVAAIAAFVPARRAAKLDPLTALRCE